jgi:hypothetical protein
MDKDPEVHVLGPVLKLPLTRGRGSVEHTTRIVTM